MSEEQTRLVNKIIEEADVARLSLLDCMKRLNTITMVGNTEFIAINTAKVSFALATSKMETAIKELEKIGG